MIYVVSDIHGCFDKYKRLLEVIGPGEDDVLYILGDLVDRGEGSMKVILDLLPRKNVICLRGNHDQEALVFLNRYVMSPDMGDNDLIFRAFQLWLDDGGASTYNAFKELGEEDRKRVISFLSSMPIYEEVTARGVKYHLSHTIPSKEKLLGSDECGLGDYIFGVPDYDRIYYDDKIMVTGHTLTEFIDDDYSGRIWKGNNHIAIDCGAVFGNPLGCLCLDTMEEIYVK